MNLYYLYYDYAIVNVPGLVNVCKVYIPDVDVVPPLNLGAVAVGTAIITTAVMMWKWVGMLVNMDNRQIAVKVG